MDTKIFYIDENDIDIIKKAAKIIKDGGLVAFPTETVYGLGANALNSDACKNIFIAKGRPQDNPLIVHVVDFDISDYVKKISNSARKLMEAFWPGPLTIIFEKSEKIPQVVTAGLSSVAIRMPENKIARLLIKNAGVPIAAPSANLSGRPSPTTIEHCIDDLKGRVDMIIGKGRCEFGLESTVVDATGEDIIILRPGAITEGMIRDVIGSVSLDPAIIKKPEGDFKPKSPGMKYRHYAPKAPLTIVQGKNEDVLEYIKVKSLELQKRGLRTGVMTVDENIDKYEEAYVLSLGSRKNPEIIASNLFDCLREFDKINVDYIYAEGFSEEGIGFAIMNRLKKAAGYSVIKL